MPDAHTQLLRDLAELRRGLKATNSKDSLQRASQRECDQIVRRVVRLIDLGHYRKAKALMEYLQIPCLAPDESAFKFMPEGAEGPVPAWARPKRQRRSADRLLRSLGSLVPRRHREALVGDLWEDVRDYREVGWSEKRIRNHIRWQIFVIVCLQCRRFLKWAAFGWLVTKIRAWIG